MVPYVVAVTVMCVCMLRECNGVGMYDVWLW